MTAQDTFFGRHSFEHGIMLNYGGESFWFFSELSILIADEVAIKQSIESKGAAGKLFCCRCSNVVSKSSWEGAVNTTGLIHGTCTDYSQFRLHTNESVQKIIKYLGEQHEILAFQQFSKLETALGFNWKPEGLLKNPTYGGIIPECIMFDWFHIFLVHGIANREFALLHDALRKVGMHGQLDQFISSFQWPKQFQGSKPNKIFGKRDSSTEPLKCSASELLSAYGIIRVFILNFVWEQHEQVRGACRTTLNLCTVLDLLCALNRGGSCSWTQLHETIKDYLDSFLAEHGDEYWVPKCHMALHLGEFLRRHGTLLSCFAHERKHRLVKRFGNPTNNFTQSFEKSILSDIIHVQVRELCEEVVVLGLALIKEKKAAPGKMDWLVDFLGRAEASTAIKAWGPNGEVCKDDVVEYHAPDGSLSVGQVMYHVRHGSTLLTVLCPWQRVHGIMFKVKHDPCVIFLQNVVQCCMYSLKDDNAMVVRR
eukprot:s839_g43.t1